MIIAQNIRPLARIIRAAATIEGADMPVRRALSAHAGVYPDPFLMLDHFGPAEVGPHTQGFPPHPHRGFETVTYMLSGAIEHNDSFGGHAEIGPGDVQWMTTGAGILHSETIPRHLQESGGTVEGLQIWVNLPKDKKAAEPGYQVIRGAELTDLAGAAPGVSGKLIAGTLFGRKGPARSFTEMTIAVLELAAGAWLDLDLPPAMNVAIYVAAGEVATADDTTVAAARTLRFEPGEGRIVLRAHTPARLLLMAGVPLHEPAVARGPFVMTTEGEVRQAMLDFQMGRFGVLNR